MHSGALWAHRHCPWSPFRTRAPRFHWTTEPTVLPSSFSGMKNKLPAGGFATVLALLIVALLVVVLVGAAMILRVETFTSSNAQKIAEARQNALYGMEMALADLQELAGPDQRVTATAELNRNATDPLWVPEYLPGEPQPTSPRLPLTIGLDLDVSKNRYVPDPATPGRVTSNIGTASNQISPEPLKWLVSAGRRKAGGVESQTNNVTPLNYPARLDGSGQITGVSNGMTTSSSLEMERLIPVSSPRMESWLPKFRSSTPAPPSPPIHQVLMPFGSETRGSRRSSRMGPKQRHSERLTPVRRSINTVSEAPQKLGIASRDGQYNSISGNRWL